MFGAHGFTKIMSAPDGILNALTAVAEKKKASSEVRKTRRNEGGVRPLLFLVPRHSLMNLIN